MPQVITASSDVPQQHASAAGTLAQPAACLPTSIPSAATLGAGDSSANMVPPDSVLVSSHHNVPDPRRHGMQQCYVTAMQSSCKTHTVESRCYLGLQLVLLDSFCSTMFVIII